MLGELNWEHLDELVESYSVVCAYGDRLHELETEITRVCSGLAATPPSLDDFNAFLESRAMSKDEVIRKIAWAMQHVFPARAWCVGQKIVLDRVNGKRLESPLIDQMTRLGARVAPMNLANIVNAWKRSGLPAQSKIDAMLVDLKAATIYLVKGHSYSQTQRLSPGLRVTAADDSLFGSDGRLFCGVQAQADAIGSLVFARDILKNAFPAFDVRLHFVVIADPDYGWSFQCHDLTDIHRQQHTTATKISLDDFPVASTSRSFAEVFQQDTDAFARLPKGSWQYLHAAPVDRPIRCLMLLEELWDRQERQPGKLVVVPTADLVESVKTSYRITYPADLLRHDLEDCLDRGKFVRRARNRTNAYGITAKGLCRAMLVRQKFNPMTVPEPNALLKAINNQARLWATAKVL